MQDLTPLPVLQDPVNVAPFDELSTALSEVLAGDAPEVGRLGYAATTVSFTVDGEGRSVTILLDREPCAIATDHPADVEIELCPSAAALFARGQLSMAAAVLSGEAIASGPVRSYLEIDPILRQLLYERAGLPEAAIDVLPRSRTAAAVDLRSDLLAIETRDLHKSFGSQRVLQGLDIRIPEGLFSVVLGPSGTGKSVLLQLVLGLIEPDSGDVLIRGRSLSAMTHAEVLDLRTQIGVMFQDGALFSSMTVYDNVAFPLRQHTDLAEREIDELVIDHLASVGLVKARDRMPNELSGGMRKRAGLARALVMNPGIVLCDEPDSGLDPVRTALLGRLLMEQHSLYGGTMVVVTHNVMLARLIGEHMSVMWQGRILESGLAQDILNSESAFVRQFLSGDSRGPLGMDA